MDLTETQRQIRDTARAFAEREIAPHAAEWDRAKATPRALYEKMAKVGLMGVCVDPKYGGAGADFVAYILAMEELSAADGGIANVMAANNSPVAAAIQQHGSDWQKENYLTKLCSGTWIGAIHLTEPHTGSDAAAIKTRAVREGEVVFVLIDTFATTGGIDNAIAVGKELVARGERLAAVRLDSGDLARLSTDVRTRLDAGGLHDTRILASSDLDEHRIAALLVHGAELDAFGVGTRLATANDSPSLRSTVPSSLSRKTCPRPTYSTFGSLDLFFSRTRTFSITSRVSSGASPDSPSSFSSRSPAASRTSSG